MDFYKVLQISPTADHKSIQKAYQKLCLTYHPDKNQNGREQFDLLQKAYETLSNPALRKDYDQLQILQNKMGAVQDVLDLDEMEFDEIKDTYQKSCRCGGLYIVTGDQLEEGVGGVQCTLCSLCVQLLYQHAEESDGND